jgi:replicative DNA helicase
MASNNKLNPSSIEFEEAILGAIILKKDAIDIIADVLTVDTFYHKANQYVYAAILKLSEEGSPIDLLTVTQQLRKDGNLEEVGGAHYISTLTNKVSSAANIKYHSVIVYQMFLKRSLIQMSEEMGKVMYDDTSDPIQYINDTQEKLLDLQSKINSLKTRPSTIGDVSEEFVNELEDRKLNGTSSMGMLCDIQALNNVIKGFRPNKLIVLAARPGMGKTSLALNIFQSFANANKSGIFFSLEMEKLELINKMISAETTIPLDKLESGNVTDLEVLTVNHYCRLHKHSRAVINDNSRVGYKSIKAAMIAHKSKYNDIDFVIIDYLQLMEVEGSKNSNANIDIGKITRELKVLSGEYQIPIILLSQLSRALENRQDKRPMESDLRDSGSIEQDADVAMFLYAPSKYEEFNETYHTDVLGIKNEEEYSLYTELIVRKNRGGKGDQFIKLDFFKPISKLATPNYNHSPIMKADYSDSGEEHYIVPYDPKGDIF